MALVAAPPSYTRMYHYYPPSSYYQSFYPPRYPGGHDFYPKSTFTATRYHNQYFATSINSLKCGFVVIVVVIPLRCLSISDVLIKYDDGIYYPSQKPTYSSNPNVFFQRNQIHTGILY
ncbi:conserved hypothetical protein [Pediculus humanus corporis]|uniref:Uncharacterized protein n=1 Tax=Pediculus humanus subsp. corporis TaxID=121224 RepID=E0VHU7_PEDHC|nr:uncharacterized protein Phum_PHUM216200 [Pediculus humanus corporis]EEB12953.1 conserved hypothetical protein [Pediculus humanus corporis]